MTRSRTALTAFLATPYREDEFLWIRNSIDQAVREFKNHHDIAIDLVIADEIVVPGEEVVPRMMEAIAKCDFGYVVVSKLNANVMIELGMLLGTPKPVVLLADNMTAQDLPFNIATRFLVRYDAENKNQRSLANEIITQTDRLLEANLGRRSPELRVQPFGYPDSPYAIREMEFIRIEGGTFQMGATPPSPRAPMHEIPYPWELPAHPVAVTTYWIAKYPTTRRQFDMFLTEYGRAKPVAWNIDGDHGDLPAVCTKFEADLFCHWLGDILNAELPGRVTFGVQITSEAEWEFAARGWRMRVGKPLPMYPWGDDRPDPDRARYNETAPSRVNAHPKGETPDGVADMAGNVFEWCRDTYVQTWKYPRTTQPLTDPVGEWGFQNILRGCDYRMSERELRATWRVGNLPGLGGRISNVMDTGARGRQSWRHPDFWMPDLSLWTRWDYRLVTHWLWSARVGFRCMFRLKDDLLQPPRGSR